jgi:hypothetical protein
MTDDSQEEMEIRKNLMLLVRKEEMAMFQRSSAKIG